MNRTAASRAARPLGLLLAPLTLGLALTGCSGDTPSAGPSASLPVTSAGSVAPTGSSSSPSGTDDASPSGPGTVDVGASGTASPTVAPPTGELKPAASAKLPTELDGMQGNVGEAGANQQVAQYTGSTEDEMLVATLTRGETKAAALGQLSGAQTVGHTTCGTIEQTGLRGCYLWLDGGNIQLYGTDQTTLEQLRKHAESLWSQLS